MDLIIPESRTSPIGFTHDRLHPFIPVPRADVLNPARRLRSRYNAAPASDAALRRHRRLGYSQGSGGAAGYVDVLPLLTQTDGWGNAVQPSTLFKLSYSRIQGGVATRVIDPVPGDIGIAVFTKRDSSGVTEGTTEPVRPASFREFDQADGFYIGGFLNQTPSIWLELKQDNTAVLKAPVSVTIDTPECRTGGFVRQYDTEMDTSVRLWTHKHGGVDPGGGNTASPNGRT